MIKVKIDEQNRTWLHLNGELKAKGYIFNGIYYTVRYRYGHGKYKSHYYNLGKGYPVDYEILEWLKNHELDIIVVIEKSMDGDKKYKSSVRKYLAADGRNDFDWGYGRQKVLALSEMRLI